MRTFYQAALPALVCSLTSAYGVRAQQGRALGAALHNTQDKAMRSRNLRIRADEAALRRRYAVPLSKLRLARLVEYAENYVRALQLLDYATLSVQGRIG